MLLGSSTQTAYRSHFGQWEPAGGSKIAGGGEGGRVAGREYYRFLQCGQCVVWSFGRVLYNRDMPCDEGWTQGDVVTTLDACRFCLVFRSMSASRVV